ncbi:MAG: CoB--CoM heterodisulfide reductase iron-sulfur subunit B family protein [Candidatus Hydrogenedentes bacterium]|nr:CoB--CoM heterodisulfide reductase iron-sulfur subunit B family protein [Candidatus Hydrogenedentota bacterium]
MEFGYYPGCALHGSSNDYEKSIRACMKVLNAGLKELDDWICCGATAAHSLNHKLSTALPARNLAIAERDGVGSVLAPCPMCSMELIKAGRALRESEQMRRQMSEIVELKVEGKTDVINLIQVFERIGIETIKSAVKNPLADLKPACYYGCLLTRPAKVVQFDDCERPRSMELILEALGAAPVSWNYATECCGAGLTMANEATVLELANKILKNAAGSGANCIVVACPMCHVNLDMKQSAVERRYDTAHGLPIYYLSDVVGLALGLNKKELAIDKHFVCARAQVKR